MAEEVTFQKSEKPTQILALILLCAFLFAAWHAYNIEQKYNRVVIKYNECINDKIDFVQPAQAIPQLPKFNFTLGDPNG